jgi:hypothetical protein
VGRKRASFLASRRIVSLMRLCLILKEKEIFWLTYENRLLTNHDFFDVAFMSMSICKFGIKVQKSVKRPWSSLERSMSQNLCDFVALLAFPGCACKRIIWKSILFWQVFNPKSFLLFGNKTCWCFGAKRNGIARNFCLQEKMGDSRPFAFLRTRAAQVIR